MGIAFVTPTTSLLVPCYNAAEHLPRLWESVRAQARTFDECICYDDGSTDDTATVASQLGARVIRGEANRGPAYARNRLWQAARTNCVHFHDADDLLDPDYLAATAARLDANTDVVICNALWYHANGAIEREWRYSHHELSQAPADYLVAHPVGGINGLYRRAALERVGGFNESLHVWEDADLHVRLALAGARFAVVEQPLVIALRRPGSISTPLVRNWTSRLAALQSYAAVRAPDSFRRAVAHETEKAAAILAGLGADASARQAIELCQQLGLNPPTTRNVILRILKLFVPSLPLLRWQARWRNRTQVACAAIESCPSEHRT